MFLKYARQYSTNQPMTLDWLCRQIGWPITTPKTIVELAHLEAVFDVLDLYLWLSYRFSDLFPDSELVRDMQKELDFIILQGVMGITKLLRAEETNTSYSLAHTSDHEFIPKSKDIHKSRAFSATYDEDINELQRLTNKSNINDFVFNKSNKQSLKESSLGKQLIKKGLITNEILSRLQEEWSQGINKSTKTKPNVGLSTKKSKK
jgi:ATP-dependent RNA helicase SUPV3L1/SUV3